jgi:hypothetical protein
MVKTKNKKVAKDVSKTLDHLISHITDLKEPIDPRDFKQAKMLINDLQLLKGEGIFDAFNKLKDIGNKLVHGRTDLSPKVKKVLQQVGDDVITSATVYRKPVQSFIQSVIRTVSSYPYDNIFHLSIIFKTNAGRTVLLEKNAAINMDVNKSITGAQSMPVNSIPGGLTINKLIENTKNRMGKNFIPYSSSSNNCQDFITNVLVSNQMDNTELNNFVKQDTSMIFKDENFKKFADSITGLGEKIEIISQGGKIINNKKISKPNNIMPRELSPREKTVHHHYHNYHINGGAIDFENLLRDTGKYLQPTFDAAQDRAMKEIRGNGWESVLRDTGKYLQPTFDAAQDRAMKEIRGNGWESVLRDTGKYLQPTFDAAQDRAMKEIKGNGRPAKGSKAAKEHMARIRAMKKK